MGPVSRCLAGCQVLMDLPGIRPSQRRTAATLFFQRHIAKKPWNQMAILEITSRQPQRRSNRNGRKFAGRVP
jgi:hypothetical protein